MTQTAKHYDLIVIGSGSGLNVADAAVRDLGWKVAIIEQGPLGGTCLNRGCIPSKIIIHSADVAEEIKKASLFGINARIENIDFETVINRAISLVDREAEEIKQAILEEENMDLYQTHGEFIGEKTLRVANDTITGARILIAAGARTLIPPIKGIERVKYLTSTEALRLTTQPKSMIIIGGGYIAAELGHFFGALGTDISIVELADTMISREDTDIAEAFTRIFSQKYKLYLGHKVIEFAEKNDGIKIVTAEDKNGERKTLAAESLLLAVGLKSNADLLKLENTKIETDERGWVKVNSYLETTEENVWALGDIIGKAPFKHAANYEAEIVYHNMKGNDKRAANLSFVPHAIFSYPQVAGVGITEQEAREKKIEYAVRKYPYSKTGMGQALEEKNGFVKFIIAPKENKILGCHILGYDASTLIHEVVVAMSAANGDVKAIKSAIHIHPALSEIIQRAL